MTLIALSNLLLEGRADHHPVALRRGELITFGRFKADVMGAAARFKNYARAALFCQDSYNFIIGFFGLLHAGATIVLPPNNHPQTLQNLKTEFDILIDDKVIELSEHETAALMPIDALRLSMVFFTSGTTGSPKKIFKSLEMLEREISALNNLWSGDTTGAVFATVSHQHIYGLTFKLLWPLMAGRSFTTETYALWENLLAALTPNAVIISSPAHLGRLGGISSLPSAQKPQRIFSAGAPLSLEASQQTEQIFGCYPIEIFGSTETGAFATRSQMNNKISWQLLPGIQIQTDEQGQLTIQSPFIGTEWLKTSDVVEPSENGFHFLGRADRIVKVEGKRISLAQVEQSLTQIAFVKTAAAVVVQGEPDRLGAAIVLNEEGENRLRAIGQFRFGRVLRDKLAAVCEPAAIPRLWRFVNVLPEQTLGKRRDADIRALFSEAA